MPQTIQKLLSSPNVPPENKIRLVALYALRYSKHPQNALNILLDLLAVGSTSSPSPNRIAAINHLLSYHNSIPPLTGLFESESIFSRARSGFKGLKGVENVYTQHTPKLEQTINQLIKGRLKEATHPFIEDGVREKPQDIIIFMVGGTTYEEARLVAMLNAGTPGVRIVLGGTSVLRSKTFLDVSSLLSDLSKEMGNLLTMRQEIEDIVPSWPDETAAGRLRREVGDNRR